MNTLSEHVAADLEARVAKGVALLDSVRADWRDWVDPEELDILSEENCILGQIWGDYFDGKSALGIEGETGFTYAFDFYCFDDVWVSTEDVKEAWLKVL